MPPREISCSSFQQGKELVLGCLPIDLRCVDKSNPPTITDARYHLAIVEIRIHTGGIVKVPTLQGLDSFVGKCLISREVISNGECLESDIATTTERQDI